MLKKTSLQRISTQTGNFLTSPYFHIFLIAVGVFLRLNHYFENRPLWLDETYVANQVLCRSWHEIFSFYRHPDTQPLAPLYFYIFVKCLVTILGNNEYVLRLLPLLCGIGSIFLFYRLLQRYFDKAVMTLALAFFVLCDRLVYYAAELKYYSLDLLVGLILIYLFEKLFLNKDLDRKAWFWWAIFGSLTLWFSYSSIFLLASIGLTLFIYNWKDSTKRLYVVCMGWIWLLNFLLLERASLRFMSGNSPLLRMWDYYKVAFLSYPVSLASFSTWLRDAFFNMFINPGDVSFPLLGLIAFVLGLIVTYFRNQKRFCLYAVCLLLLLIAAALRKYPFYGRMLIFFVPVIFIMMAEGIVFLMKGRTPLMKVLAMIVIVLLFYKPLNNAVYYLKHPRYENQGDIRAILKYFKKKYIPGDFVFINNHAFLQVGYYFQKFGLFDLMPKKLILDDIGGSNEYLYFIDMARFATILLLEGEELSFMEFDRMMFLVNQGGFYRGGIATAQKYIDRDTPYKFPTERTWLILITIPENEKDFLLDFFHYNGRLIDRYENKTYGIYLFERR